MSEESKHEPTGDRQAMDLDYPRKLTHFFMHLDELNLQFQQYMDTHPGLGLSLERLVFLSRYTQMFGDMNEYLQFHQGPMRMRFSQQQQEEDAARRFPLDAITTSKQLFTAFVDKYELGSHTRIGQIHNAEATIAVVHERLKRILTRPKSKTMYLVIFLCLLVVVTPVIVVLSTVSK